VLGAGGALLGYIAGEIVSTDPAFAAFIGPAASGHMQSWAGRAGALLVVGFGLIKVGRGRRLSVEDVLAGVGLLIWLGADMAIAYLIPETAVLTRWATRGGVFLLLAAGYFALRSGRAVGREEV